MNESDCRVPNFVAGTPVTLTDGQTWFLANPKIVTEALAGPNGPILVPTWTLGIGVDYDRELVAHLNDSPDPVRDPDGIAHYRRAVLGVASLLLLRNYNLASRQCRELLEPTGRDPDADVRLMTALMTVAFAQPLAAMVKAMQRLPYRDAREHAAVDPATN
jgi:hypothetical protein